MAGVSAYLPMSVEAPRAAPFRPAEASATRRATPPAARDFSSDAQPATVSDVVDHPAERVEGRDVLPALAAENEEGQGEIRFALPRDLLVRVHIPNPAFLIDPAGFALPERQTQRASSQPVTRPRDQT